MSTIHNVNDHVRDTYLCTYHIFGRDYDETINHTHNLHQPVFLHLLSECVLSLSVRVPCRCRDSWYILLRINSDMWKRHRDDAYTIKKGKVHDHDFKIITFVIETGSMMPVAVKCVILRKVCNLALQRQFERRILVHKQLKISLINMFTANMSIKLTICALKNNDVCIKVRVY